MAYGDNSDITSWSSAFALTIDDYNKLNVTRVEPILKKANKSYPNPYNKNEIIEEYDDFFAIKERTNDDKSACVNGLKVGNQDLEDAYFDNLKKDRESKKSLFVFLLDKEIIG